MTVRITSTTTRPFGPAGAAVTYVAGTRHTLTVDQELELVAAEVADYVDPSSEASETAIVVYDRNGRMRGIRQRNGSLAQVPFWSPSGGLVAPDGSTVPVGGGGGITVDATPTSGSTNAVSSGGMFTALAGKVDSTLINRPPLSDGTSIQIGNAGNATMTAGGVVAVGWEAGMSNTTGAIIAIGFRALRENTTGLDHIAIGKFALRDNVGGVGNTAIGTESQMFNQNGGNNTSVGDISLRNCTTGANNSVLGYGAANLLTTGNQNVAVGQAALFSATTGSNHTAIGYGAMQNSGAGQNNVAVGHTSLLVASSTENTAIGYWALRQTTTGGGNVAVGAYAGFANTAGIHNTFVGESAGNHPSQVATVTNSTAIGRYSYTTASNQVVIGGDAVTQVLANGQTFQVGGRDRTTPGDTVLRSPSVPAGTTNGGVGGNFFIDASRSTGTGAGGAIAFRVSPSGAPGTAVNAQLEALIIARTGEASFASNVYAGATASYFFNTRAGLSSPADGVILLRNNAGGDFSRLQFGGFTAAFPALRRAATVLQSRLADDSDFAPLQGRIRTHAAAVAETPAATHTLRLFDAAGTEYRVLAVAV